MPLKKIVILHDALNSTKTIQIPANLRMRVCNQVLVHCTHFLKKILILNTVLFLHTDPFVWMWYTFLTSSVEAVTLPEVYGLVRIVTRAVSGYRGLGRGRLRTQVTAHFRVTTHR